MKLLIIRTDKIGDVILSLPVAQTIRASVPDAEIHMMVAEPITDLLSEQPFIDGIIPYHNKGIRNVTRILRNGHYDTAILLHPTFPLSLELFCARIPRRIGTGYRWYSFLMNNRIFEHRRSSEKHEIEYNLGLLKPLGIAQIKKQPVLSISPEMKERAKRMLGSAGIDWRNFILIHPGSGGSTLPLPEQSYKQLVSLLVRRADSGLVLTGSIDEKEATERVREGIEERAITMAGKTTISELAGIISLARLFIGNSTGPMHIASATGIPIVAFFPPSRANRKTRWAPLTPSLIFEPPVPHCRRCIREQCAHFNCMTLIEPEGVFEKIEKWLGNEPAEKRIT
jgi:ADP-heptose:LPS heptosyltransferase